VGKEPREGGDRRRQGMWPGRLAIWAGPSTALLLGSRPCARPSFPRLIQCPAPSKSLVTSHPMRGAHLHQLRDTIHSALSAAINGIGRTRHSEERDAARATSQHAARPPHPLRTSRCANRSVVMTCNSARAFAAVVFVCGASTRSAPSLALSVPPADRASGGARAPRSGRAPHREPRWSSSCRAGASVGVARPDHGRGALLPIQPT